MKRSWLAWNDGLVVKLARAIYADRDWALMPQLADALEEAGCPAGEACPRCEGRGDGLENGTMESSCQDCHGNGRVPHPLLTHLRGQDAGPCPTCKGVGTLTMNLTGARCQCRDCHGTGRVGHPLPAHLRDGGPHARGCHVLDLLLGYK